MVRAGACHAIGGLESSPFAIIVCSPFCCQVFHDGTENAWRVLIKGPGYVREMDTHPDDAACGLTSYQVNHVDPSGGNRFNLYVLQPPDTRFIPIIKEVLAATPDVSAANSQTPRHGISTGAYATAETPKRSFQAVDQPFEGQVNKKQTPPLSMRMIHPVLQTPP